VKPRLKQVIILVVTHCKNVIKRFVVCLFVAITIYMHEILLIFATRKLLLLTYCTYCIKKKKKSMDFYLKAKTLIFSFS